MRRDVLEMVGLTIDGRYRVDEVIGEGGFGIVYRGWHVTFQHRIAIKCLKVPFGAQRALLESFLEEGRLQSPLASQHMSFVRLFDAGVTKNGHGTIVPYLASEWLDGQDLEKHLEQRAEAGLGPYGEVEAIGLLRPVLQALALAHQSVPRIAHRDLKPANLFLLRDGHLKVLDFGIAKAMEQAETATQPVAKTRSPIVAYSPAYGAPEQFRMGEEHYPATGPWTDVHALGLILVELVTGAPALEGATHFSYGLAATATPRPTPRARGAGNRVSDGFEAVCLRALALRPADRYQSAGQLLDALDALSLPMSNSAPFRPAAVAARSQSTSEPARRVADVPDSRQPPRRASSRDETLHTTFRVAASASPSEWKPRLPLHHSGRIMVATALALGVAGFLYARTTMRESRLRSTQVHPMVERPGGVTRIPRVEVVVHTDIEGAELLVDGESYGTASKEVWVLDLPPGLHVLRARSGGTDVTSSTLTVREGVPATVVLAMPEGSDMRTSADAQRANTPGPAAKGRMTDDVHQSLMNNTVPGVVGDATTGLEWQRELPAVYDGCSGRYTLQGSAESPGSACTWSDAERYCATLTLGGRTDWRLPSLKELSSIVKQGARELSSPSANFAVFPASRTASDTFWTSSPSAKCGGCVWIIDFHHGNRSEYGDRAKPSRVRCVRSAPALLRR